MINNKTDQALYDEATHFYKLLFRDSPTQEILKLYCEAHFYIPELVNAPSNQIETVQKVMSLKLNAVVIEPFLRKRVNRHILTSKLMLLIYFEESANCRKGFESRNRNNSVDLLFELTAATINMAKGIFFKIRYGLV